MPKHAASVAARTTGFARIASGMNGSRATARRSANPAQSAAAPAKSPTIGTHTHG